MREKNMPRKSGDMDQPKDSAQEQPTGASGFETLDALYTKALSPDRLSPRDGEEVEAACTASGAEVPAAVNEAEIVRTLELLQSNALTPPLPACLDRAHSRVGCR